MHKSKPHSAERRKFPRFKSYNIIEIIHSGHEPVAENPKLIDMSEGGLRFYSNDPVKKGEKIKIRIDISEFNSSVTAFARVVWAQPSTEHTGAHFTGVEFVGMKETERDVIRRLEKASRKKG